MGLWPPPKPEGSLRSDGGFRLRRKLRHLALTHLGLFSSVLNQFEEFKFFGGTMFRVTAEGFRNSKF